MTVANEAQGGSNNPLLVPSDAPFQTVPFNKIQLPDYEEAIMEAIKIHDGEIEAIVSTSEEPTFENTIAALDRSGSLLNESVLALSNLVEAVGDTTMMQMMTRVTPVLSDHSTGLLLNDKLWQRIKKVYENKGQRTDLSPEAMRLIDETYRSFAESGANLEGEAREKYRKLSAELSDLNVKFSQNVTNGMADPERRMWVKEADTAGLPESIKAAAREAAKEALEAEGKPDDASLYLFTVYAPSYTPFMKYADNRELREKLYKINGSRNVGGQYDNTQILKDIANIRLEIANLMGKKTFAEYQLQGTMAATPERVMELLEDLRQNYTVPMQAELKEIEEYAQRTEGPDFKLMPWDYSYWSDKLKNDKYAFNDEDMKPYFELENTINGVLGLTDNDALASGIIRHFVDNEPNPGIETEFEMVKAILPNIPVMAINQVCSQLLSDNNMVIVTAEPQREGFEIVAEEVMVKTVTDAMHAQYEAYVDEVITEPLIANLPKPGTIKSVTEDKSIGAQIFTLSNGVKVVLKTTDFAADEVLLTAFREGGRRSYNQADAANVALMGLAFSSSKMGPFDRKTLDKYLAGKQANVGFTINSYTDVLSGFSTVKDLPTMMELVYTAFTNLGMDQATYDVNEGRNRVILQNAASNPEKIFSDVLAATQYPDNALMQGITVATLDNANYAKMLEMVKAALSNAADYTFVFTGNVDEAAIRPLLEQYIATLPAAGPRKVNTVSPISTAKGDVVKHFNQVMQTPSTIVEDIYTDNNVPFNQKNDIMVEMVGDILDNIYTETLREEEGGTYGAAVGAYINPNDGYWSLIYKFQTNKDQQQSLIDRAQAELMKLLNEGTNEEQFNKVKQAMIKQIEINVRTNQYWNSNLMTYLRGFDVITDYQKTIESITLADLNKFMKGLYNGKNRIQVIMEGVAE